MGLLLKLLAFVSVVFVLPYLDCIKLSCLFSGTIGLHSNDDMHHFDAAFAFSKQLYLNKPCFMSVLVSK
jgi:hypothetical protein